MATSIFSRGNEPLILGTAETYPEHSYSQEEFLDALLKVRSANWVARCVSRTDSFCRGTINCAIRRRILAILA